MVHAGPVEEMVFKTHDMKANPYGHGTHKSEEELL